MKSIAEKQVHCDFIDGLRGIAILMVLVNHWYTFCLKSPGESFAFTFSERWIVTGKNGVLLFFLVSAFTLFQSSQARFQSEKRPIRNFYIRRAFRILPLWWVSVALYEHYHGIPFFRHWCCYSMLFGFDPGNHTVVGSWTLFVEETFYLFLPLVFVYLSSIRRAVLFVVATYTLRLIWLRVGPFVGTPEQRFFHPFVPFAHWYCFGIGILLFQGYRNPFFRALFQEKRWALPLSLMAAFSCFRFLGRNGGWGMGDDFSAVALAIFFLAALNPFSIFGKLARLKILRQFGICCYSLYLFNGLLFLILGPRLRSLDVYQRLVSAAPMELILLASFPILALGLLPLAKLSFHAFEYPAVRLGKSLIRRLEKGASFSAALQGDRDSAHSLR